MWENLLRVDWYQLHHAYGRADDAPAMLRYMLSDDPERRHKGWDYFWGSLHHQGDYYNSTVAVVPFLVEAVADPGVGGRARLLSALERLWANAPGRDGFPLTPDPPGGVDEPTPQLDDAEYAAAKARGIQEPPCERADPDEDAFKNSRRADLCAWQAGRAVRVGLPTYLKLLEDEAAEVVRAAASLLGVWADTREVAQRAMVRCVDRATSPSDQVRLVLEFGKYGADDPFPHLERWLSADRPFEVRTAAALAWAWAVSPAPLPPAVVGVLEAASVPRSKVFPTMPEIGVYSHWGLPPNLGWLVLRLAKSTDKELRWRMVQNFGHATATAAGIADEDAVPVLIGRLSDRFGRIREAAAKGLAHRGPRVLAAHPGHIATLLDALRPHTSARWGGHAGLDSDSSPCGHIAHLLACAADRLTAGQRRTAIARIRAASERFRGRADEHVMLGTCWHNAHDYLRRQYEHLAKPPRKTLTSLLAEIAVPANDDRFRPLLDADRDLADRYEKSPDTFLASLCTQLTKSTPAGHGAVDWLRKLGSSAAALLTELDAKAATITPPAAAWGVTGAAKFIRWARRFKSPPASKRPRTEPTTTDRIAQLRSADVASRVTAAMWFASYSDLTAAQRQEATTALLHLLRDDASVEYGLKGRCEIDGRLYFWRMQRTTPRAAAVLALAALGHQPENAGVFDAMLAEAGRAAVVCGGEVVPRQFPLEWWRSAVRGAGGMTVCERHFDRLLKELDGRPYSDEVNEQFACADEVKRVAAALTERR